MCLRHQTAVDCGAYAASPKTSSRHGHPGHVLLRQQVGIWMYPSLQSMRPSGNTSYADGVVYKIEEQKASCKYCKGQQRVFPPLRMAIATKIQRHPCSGKYQQGRRKVGYAYQYTGDYYRQEYFEFHPWRGEVILVRRNITGKAYHQQHFRQLRWLELSKTGNRYPAPLTHNQDYQQQHPHQIEYQPRRLGYNSQPEM